MSSEYKSIETVFVRNPITHTLELGNPRTEAASLINAWSVTEKVDGMNIRAIFYLTTDDAPNKPNPTGALVLEVKGRTDNAILPPGVREAVERQFSEEGRGIIRMAWAKELEAGHTVTFYGEAFGEGIQKNPLRLAGKRFRVFDILVADRKWLSDSDVRSLAQGIGFATVPLVGLINRVPRNEAELNECINGGLSSIATEPVRPEGIVARPLIPLFDTYGNRIIWKLTYREFDKIRALEKANAEEAQRMPEPVL